MTSRRSVLKAAGAFAALAAGTAGLAYARAARAEAAYPPEGTILDVDGVPVHYLRRGSGPEVVLLHGAGGNLRDFSFDLMDRLAGRYSVTAFDRPGLGYTGRVRGYGPGTLDGESPAEQADLLRRAAEAIGIEAPVVAGHSFGGIVAYAWALSGLDRPGGAAPRGIVSLAGVTLPWPGELGAYYQINGSAAGYATIPALAAFVPGAVVRDRIDGTFAPQPAPEGYADHIGAGLTLRADSFAANIRQVNTLYPHVVEMERRYPDLSLPIEILHGTADETVPIDVHARPFAARHPQANLTELPGVGHMPHHVDPEAALAAIDRAFARSQERPA